jgi:hypothetical protein
MMVLRQQLGRHLCTQLSVAAMCTDCNLLYQYWFVLYIDLRFGDRLLSTARRPLTVSTCCNKWAVLTASNMFTWTVFVFVSTVCATLWSTVTAVHSVLPTAVTVRMLWSVRHCDLWTLLTCTVAIGFGRTCRRQGTHFVFVVSVCLYVWSFRWTYVNSVQRRQVFSVHKISDNDALLRWENTWRV